MNRKVGIGMLSCILAMGLQAETIRVMRFVPVAGAESEVALNSLQKVVFSQDSIVLIAAADGEATPLYKYDYRSIQFAENGSTEIEEVGSETVSTVRSEKFIKDGQLYIRLDENIYTILGNKIQ